MKVVRVAQVKIQAVSREILVAHNLLRCGKSWAAFVERGQSLQINNVGAMSTYAPTSEVSLHCDKRRGEPTNDVSWRSNSQLHLRSVYGLHRGKCH
jgi:hypothetical protein